MTDENHDLHPARRGELEELARRIGHRFRDVSLLERALCHSSTGNEGRESYERLEFLGDAVLGFLVAEALYRYEPEIPEGQLTDRRAQLVSRQPLARVAQELELGKYLVGGRGLREQDRCSRRILADLTESVLASILLDGGIRAARKFVRRHVLRLLADALPALAERDPKSRLLHFTQVHFRDQPAYELVESAGPDHERTFKVAVVIEGRVRGIGAGRTKQAAEKEAARVALRQLRSELAAGPAKEDG